MQKFDIIVVWTLRLLVATRNEHADEKRGVARTSVQNMLKYAHTHTPKHTYEHPHTGKYTSKVAGEICATLPSELTNSIAINIHEITL